MTRSSLSIVLAMVTVLPAAGQDMPLSQVIIPTEGWKALPGKYSAVTASANGLLFAADLTTETVHRLHGLEGAKSVGNTTAVVTSLAIAPDGTIYAAQPEKKRIVRFKADASEETVASGKAFRYLAIGPSGGLYSTAGNSADVFLVSNGKTEVAASELKAPTALFVTPDGGTVVVGVHYENHLWAFGVDPKTHKLTHRDRYYYPLRQVLQGETDTRVSALDRVHAGQGRSSLRLHSSWCAGLRPDRSTLWSSAGCCRFAGWRRGARWSRWRYSVRASRRNALCPEDEGTCDRREGEIEVIVDL